MGKTKIIAIGPPPPTDAETAALLAELRGNVRDYKQEQRQAEHDPVKLLVAGMVNAKMLHDASKESEAAAKGTGMKAVSPEQLKEMQNWVFRYRQNHIGATETEVHEAVCKAFNLVIVPDEPE